MISDTEQESVIIVDDTYAILAVNTRTKKIVNKIQIGSSVLKCSLVAEACLFLGLTSGAVQMYDAYTLELVA
jgi:hypothetical protein